MMISSSEALPARSPMPLKHPSTWVAPARMASSELAAAMPRSLWQCTLILALSMFGTRCMMAENVSYHSPGTAKPTVSGMFTTVAPALMTSSSVRHR